MKRTRCQGIALVLHLLLLSANLPGLRLAFYYRGSEPLVLSCGEQARSYFLPGGHSSVAPLRAHYTNRCVQHKRTFDQKCTLALRCVQLRSKLKACFASQNRPKEWCRMPEGSLAYRLRVARLEKGLTLREAAKVTGVDKATISAVERNKRKPFDVTLSRLAKGYGVSISQLVEELVGEKPGQPLKEKAREWFQEAGGDRDLLHGMDDEAWETYVENLDTPEEVSETYRKMQDERKMFQAF